MSWNDEIVEKPAFNNCKKFKENLSMCQEKKQYELSSILAKKMSFVYINLYESSINSISDSDEFIAYCRLEIFAKRFSNNLIFKQQEKHKYMAQITAAFLTKFDKYIYDMMFSYECLEIEFKPQ